MSVRLMTPARWPLILAPGRALAEMEGPEGAMKGEALLGEMPWLLGPGEGGMMVDAALGVVIEEKCEDGWTRVAEWVEGVGGPEDEGEAGSVTQRRWLSVATSLAVVCASVLAGVT